MHKGCGLHIVHIQADGFLPPVAGQKMSRLFFFVSFAGSVCAVCPELERQPACCCLGTMSPINPGAEALLTSCSRAPFHSCGVGKWT